MSNEDDLFDIEIEEDEDQNLDDLPPKKSSKSKKMMNRSLKNPEEMFSASNVFFNSKHESKDLSGENSEVNEFLNTLINTTEDEKFKGYLNQIK